MTLRSDIERLLEMTDDELLDGHTDELEDTIQLGMSAVHSGELWVVHVRRELERATAAGEEYTPALAQELDNARRSVAAVRAHVEQLAERAHELGVGAPASRT